MKVADLKRYRSIIYDCDGVLLDSNKVKTDAFFAAALPYGERFANQLVEYHCNNGGISRYRKFEYFLLEIMGLGLDEAVQSELLNVYAREVKSGLLACPVTAAIPTLRRLTSNVRQLVVSGGDQEELRKVFKERNIEQIFDGGIFGSPDTKEMILERELAIGNIMQPALFVGDSRYDHEAASRYNIDFLFVSGWSEFQEWRQYQKLHGFPTITSLDEWLAIV